MVVSIVYMYMHIKLYVVAACRSVLVNLCQSSKLMPQGLIVAKVQSALLASCHGQ